MGVKEIFKKVIKEKQVKEIVEMIRCETLHKTKVAHWAQLKQSIEPARRPMYMKI